MMEYVHLDEKWIYLAKKKQRFYLDEYEKDPHFDGHEQALKQQNAPNSPASRAGTAPPDSVATASRAEVVDVTGGDEPWTAASVRSTTEPPHLRTSKRAASRGATAGAPTEARKGKKKATKCVASLNASATWRKKADEGADDASDQDLEEKAAPPNPNRSKKASPPAESASIGEIAAPTRPEHVSGSREEFDLSLFMTSFEPGRGTATGSVPTSALLAKD
ncbi:hypothetical protein PInf_014244 [Phytophthora infestans]|nr:hypothetical protein PInf_014244 [Phytophthora infestans]